MRRDSIETRAVRTSLESLARAGEIVTVRHTRLGLWTLTLRTLDGMRTEREIEDALALRVPGASVRVRFAGPGAYRRLDERTFRAEVVTHPVLPPAAALAGGPREEVA